MSTMILHANVDKKRSCFEETVNTTAEGIRYVPLQPNPKSKIRSTTMYVQDISIGYHSFLGYFPCTFGVLLHVQYENHVEGVHIVPSRYASEEMTDARAT